MSTITVVCPAYSSLFVTGYEPNMDYIGAHCSSKQMCFLYRLTIKTKNHLLLSISHHLANAVTFCQWIDWATLCIFSEKSDFLKYWLDFCDRFWPGAVCSSGADGWELIQVDTSSYLPRTSYFHLINIYSVVGPAAIVVKLNVPSHAPHLHLREGDIVKL